LFYQQILEGMDQERQQLNELGPTRATSEIDDDNNNNDDEPTLH
jgi:hypothetical protein